VFAKAVIVLGEVTGNVTASDKVDIRDNGSVDGDIVSPRVAIAEGAHFRGSVDMQRKGAPAQPKAEVKPVAQAALTSPTPPAQPAAVGAGQRVGA
jgi:cytoskeletal protein CcmA (bactofilin family)